MEAESDLFSPCLGGDSIDFRDSFGIEQCTAAALEWIEWEEKVHTRYNLFSESPTSVYCEKASEATPLDTDGVNTVTSARCAVATAPVTRASHPDSVPTNPPSEGERLSEPAAPDSDSMSSNKQRCYFDSDTLALKHNPK